MGDFYLDFRPPGERQHKNAAEFLRFFPDMAVEILACPEFHLVLTFADDLRLWGPYLSPGGDLAVALCGRLAFEESVWKQAQTVQGEGGLAAKAVSEIYRREGPAGLEQLDGNFVLLVHDRIARKIYLVTDPAGIMPAYGCLDERPPVYSSHPDALADATGERRNWDEVSLAEFALKGELTAPFTYYSRLRALDFGSIHTFDLQGGAVKLAKRRRYLNLQAAPYPEEEEQAIAELLAQSFQRSLRRRTYSFLGKPGVGLSGGLDSRTVLCAIPDRDQVISFSTYDEENVEFRIARQIARAAGVEFVPIRRDWNLYAGQAEMGVRISGGMGCFSCNHYLGLRDQFRDLGIVNLLTGCYCDYLFKGLGLNRQMNRWTMRERLGDFKQEHYFKHYHSRTPLGQKVEERLASSVPRSLWNQKGLSGILEVERRRVLPLNYEGDNAQRVIPQRVMGWYVPVADRSMVEIHCRATPSMKLNRSMFARTVARVCDAGVAAIPDANTGAPVNASVPREVAQIYSLKIANRLKRLTGARGTSGSWMNWHGYLKTNPKIKEMWERPNPVAWDFFEKVFGPGRVQRSLDNFPAEDLELYLQLITLKLWFEWRA